MEIKQCKETLIKKLDKISIESSEYANDITNDINSFGGKGNYNNLSDFIIDYLHSEKRSYFTISSKDTFNNFETENVGYSFIYTPLNDHSRLYMKKGDVVFCYRQGQFDSLDEALDKRGIYAVGMVLSNPQELYLSKTNHERWGVAITLPFIIKEHLELRNIQLNPKTINLTPYNGNRNDALQYIAKEEHFSTLLSMIGARNDACKEIIRKITGYDTDGVLPVDFWKGTKPLASSIKDEFRIFLKNCCKTGRASAGNITLTDTAVSSYVSYLDKNNLFGYDLTKWAHITSMYDITDVNQVRTIVDTLYADPDFKKWDLEKSYWPSGAIVYYLCFLRAKQLFSNVSSSITIDKNIKFEYPLQQIFYGAPGTGKSHTIKEQTKGDDTVIRTTFHPDSDYSTFVGCYKPTMSEKPKPIYGFDATGKTVKVDEERKIEYKFIQQAFTKAYIKAWKKMCDTSFGAKTATAMPPIGKASTPYTRTSKIGDYEDFDCTFDKATLTDSEKAALLEVDNFDFPFDGIDNFGELHKKIKKVIVTDEPTPEQNERYKKTITLTAEQIRELCRLYLENRNVYWFLESILSKILKKLGWSWPDLDKLKNYYGEDITIEEEESSSSLLGLYDPAEKTVYLFKNNIGNNIGLLCAVYIHEMFHAYYDSGNKYIPEIEEPIVECNTLCFLELFNKAYLDSYKISVERKQKTIVINFYGFGAHLYENRSLDWMRLYQNAYNQIDASSAIVKEYKDKFNPIYPFGNEDYTRNLLYAILNPQYDEISIPKLARQFLIIEEINRGNCAQIFGDLFQLLDRKDGYSEYPIEPDEDLRKELEKEFKHVNFDAIKQEIDDIFKENYRGGITEKIKSGELLVLPRNLFIWATMNTSDQSLFPIDSAFKRRWEWKYVPIVQGYDKKTGTLLEWKIKVGDKEYDWWKFLQAINRHIGDTTKSEDKKLGYFFCKAENGIITAETFVGKVLFYLWNDVYKDYDHSPAFFRNESGQLIEYGEYYVQDASHNTIPNIELVKSFIEKVEPKFKETPMEGIKDEE